MKSPTAKLEEDGSLTEVKPELPALTIDRVAPGAAWNFDAEVTDAFDDMLARSIPQYDVMRKLVFELAVPFVQRKTAVIDLGCSRGGALAPFVDKFGVQIQAVGVEVSPPMLEAARQRFDGYIKAGCVIIQDCDLRKDFPKFNASVILSVLTLQFTPLEHRSRILRRAYDALLPGGAFILVEKVTGAAAATDDILVKHYHALKEANGYGKDDIQRKSLALEGVLVPLTAVENHHRLKDAGFNSVECFWRYLCFAAWIAIKE